MYLPHYELKSDYYQHYCCYCYCYYHFTDESFQSSVRDSYTFVAALWNVEVLTPVLGIYLAAAEEEG